MSDLAKCLLCGCEPNESFDLFDMNIASYNCDTHDCPIAESGLSLTFDEWTALMGRGELAGWMNEHGETLSAEQKATGLYFDCETFTTPLYTQAPAVSSDPARFRQIGFTRIDHIGKPSSTIISDVKYRAVSDAGVYVPVFVDEGESQAPAVDGADFRHAVLTAWIWGYEKGHDDTVESRYGCIEEQAKDYVEDQFGKG